MGKTGWNKQAYQLALRKTYQSFLLIENYWCPLKLLLNHAIRNLALKVLK